MCPDIRLGNQGQQGQGPEGREEMQLVGVEERRGQELCSLGWQGRLWRRGLGEGLPGSGKVSGKAWRRSGNHPVIQVWGTGEWLK